MFSTVIGANDAHAARQASNIDNTLASLTQTLHLSKPGQNMCCANPAQRFKTGTDSNGYTLSSVKIRFAGIPSANKRPVVTIRESTANTDTTHSSTDLKPSQIPGSVVATLTASSWPTSTTLFDNQVVTFNAPDNTNLAHSTWYFLHIEGKDSGLIRYTKDSSDSGSGGWEIANEGWWYVPYWRFWVYHANRILPIDIDATARTTPIMGNQAIDEPTDSKPTSTPATPTYQAVNPTYQAVNPAPIDEPADDEPTGTEESAGEPPADTTGPTPLTASWTPPSSHDGTQFWVELQFSEAPSRLSFRHLRDHIVTADGAQVLRAKRLERGSNLGWRLLVQPYGAGEVTVTLAASGACGTQTAVCTQDGRALSHTLVAEVQEDDG